MLVDSPTIQVGDLRHARSAAGGPSRLVLVVAANGSESVQVTLVHAEPEMATSRDLVIPQGCLGLPYDLVIQTDLGGVVWRTDLGQRVGHLPQALIDAYFSCDLPAEIPQVYVGTALAGSLDARWSFKEQEGDEIEALSADCTATILDGRSWWRPDVGDLLPRFLAHAPRFERAMDDLVKLWLDSGAEMDIRSEDWQTIVDLRLGDRDVWVEHLGEEIGGPFWDAVLAQWYFESIRSNRPTPPHSSRVEELSYEQLVGSARR